MTINERRSLPLWKKVVAILISILAFGFQAFLIVLFFIVLASFEGEFYKSVVGILFIFFQLIGIGYVLYILRKPISLNYKLTWTFLILISPIPFCLLYTLNSNTKKLSRKKQKMFNNAFKELKVEYNETINDDYDLKPIINSIRINNRNFPVFSNTEYKFFNDAEIKHYDMIEELKKAEKYILLEYFIIAEGYVMDSVFEVLNERANNGVKIYFLYDDVGSKGLSVIKLVKRLSNIKNISINNYQPLGNNYNLMFNYRDHRKICVIDGKIAYCGGDNLADEYIHKKERFGFWRDNCGKYEGPAVMSFVYLFSQMWYLSTKQIIFNDLPPSTYEEVEGNGYIIPFGDGPSSSRNLAYDSFMAMIINAKNYLYISTPYLITDEAMLTAIEAKAKCGLDVKILMPGIPDKKPVFYMGRSSYSRLLHAGVKIYEITGCFNHAKNIIVDDRYAFEGTINMDYRSLFLHYECGAIIMDNPEIYKMRNDFIKTLSKSEQVLKEEWEKRPLIQKIIAFILNIIAPFF
ncbi:MAG: cardiolipin synthase [Acholeplasmatales bacterium]|nr:cardiolipin synthase [Acholeplasmatales bacterium]